MSEYLRTGIIAALVVVVIVASSLAMFVFRRESAPASVYAIESAELLENMTGISDTLLDRNYIDFLLPAQILQQNYERLAGQQPPLSQLIQHAALVRKLKPCDSAATLLTQSIVDMPLDQVGEGYEQLGRCLKAVAEVGLE